MKRILLALALLLIFGQARVQGDLVGFTDFTYDQDPTIVLAADTLTSLMIELDVTEDFETTLGGISFTYYNVNSATVFQNGVEVAGAGIDTAASSFTTTDFGPDSLAIGIVFDGLGTIFNVAGTLEASFDGTYGDLNSFVEDANRQNRAWEFDDGGTGYTGRLSSVPEPASGLALIGMGIACCLRRRR